MDINSFFKGLAIGFSIAAPVGPIGVLCIKRTLSSGKLHGMLSGLGAATADALYGSIAAFGLTFLSGFLVQQQTGLRLVGGLFLCYLGIRTVLTKPANALSSPVHSSLLSSYGSTFFLTLTNPLTILSFAAIFAGFGLVTQDGGYSTAGLTVLGVFLGSSCWWFILTGATSLLRNRLSLTNLHRINLLSGLIILGFGITILTRVFIPLR